MLISGGAKWDTVQKRGGTGEIDHSFDDPGLNGLRSLWCMKYHSCTLCDKIKKVKDKKYEIWKIMKPLQSEVKEAFDQWETELIDKLGKTIAEMKARMKEYL